MSGVAPEYSLLSQKERTPSTADTHTRTEALWMLPCVRLQHTRTPRYTQTTEHTASLFTLHRIRSVHIDSTVYLAVPLLQLGHVVVTHITPTVNVTVPCPQLLDRSLLDLKNVAATRRQV